MELRNLKAILIVASTIAMGLAILLPLILAAVAVSVMPFVIPLIVILKVAFATFVTESISMIFNSLANQLDQFLDYLADVLAKAEELANGDENYLIEMIVSDVSDEGFWSNTFTTAISFNIHDRVFYFVGISAFIWGQVASRWGSGRMIIY